MSQEIITEIFLVFSLDYVTLLKILNFFSSSNLRGFLLRGLPRGTGGFGHREGLQTSLGHSDRPRKKFILLNLLKKIEKNCNKSVTKVAKIRGQKQKHM